MSNKKIIERLSKAKPILVDPDEIANLYERFWLKVDRDFSSPEACWEWLGATGHNGYGRMKISGQMFSPHSVAYTLAYGPIENVDHFHGTVIMHKCDNRKCCRPSHLVAGTQKENVKDMIDKGRQADHMKKDSA